MAPKIVTATQIGLRFTNVFGALGPERFVTGHHTAGPKDTSDAHAMSLARTYHADHARKGWGGLGYHYMITRRGTILCLRPTALKGAHVGGHNSNNIGIVCNGTVGDRPSIRQRRALKWLLANAHTAAMPKAHRTDVSLVHATRRGHNDWSGHQSNACPGTHKKMYLSGGETR
ncbi:MAG: peptidoglycan recognition family protein [Patulibacter minatonensis]